MVDMVCYTFTKFWSNLAWDLNSAKFSDSLSMGRILSEERKHRKTRRSGPQKLTTADMNSGSDNFSFMAITSSTLARGKTAPSGIAVTGMESFLSSAFSICPCSFSVSFTSSSNVTNVMNIALSMFWGAKVWPRSNWAALWPGDGVGLPSSRLMLRPLLGDPQGFLGVRLCLAGLTLVTWWPNLVTKFTICKQKLWL